jgi:quercetin dioxygenase-like cupin family protein
LPAGAAAPSASQDEQLAAIQKGMNELEPAAQACWAAAATERFDIAGELAVQVEIAAAGSPGLPGSPGSRGPVGSPGSSGSGGSAGARRSHSAVVRDTVHHPGLAACVASAVASYPWAPPLDGQTIQLPFRFRAPDGQNTIDRRLVDWHTQGAVGVQVLLDQANSGSAAASMFELAIAAGGTTGLRIAERTELWYFAAPGEVRLPVASPSTAAPQRSGPAIAAHRVAEGDMMFVPRGVAREVAATGGALHAMVAMVPGGREGAARSGALPTPEAQAGAPRSGAVAVLWPAADAQRIGGALVYGAGRAGEQGGGRARDQGGRHAGDPTDRRGSDRGGRGNRDRTGRAASGAPAALSAAVVALPAEAAVAEHAHAQETELLYVLDGTATLRVAGVALPVSSTSVVQIPPGIRHSLAVARAFRAVQIYAPAGPVPLGAAP